MYAAIWHRSHIAIMSAYPLTLSNGVYNYNFSVDSTQVYGGTAGYKQLATGIWGMASGDANGDGVINTTDKTIWRSEAGNQGYLITDFNMDTQVSNDDANDLWLQNTALSSQIPD
jgi:hypothetical protein